MAKHFLGKDVTAALNERLAEKSGALRAKGIVPKLTIVRCGENPSDMAYEKGALKRAAVVGVETEVRILPEMVTAEALIAEIEALNTDEAVHGVLLFRPLPRHLKERESEICNHLRPEKDVDCMTDLSHAGVYTGKALGFPPCTAEACMTILAHYGYDLTGKRAVVIGRSLVIGKPVAMMLTAANATVTLCHTKTRNLPAVTAEADLIVTAAGALKSLTKEYVRPGQVVIDVAMNWDPDKKDGQGGFAGDALFEEVEPVVEAITPVPGGVGAVTTSVLMSHVVAAAERSDQR
ncbi:MAG: bifunctional 5,10-methylenetetrahydrofolate dehydrogenase/5,10-methenyltetrahydrofolate cyclohydrolase [Lachnospiraceae bacterium]|nr:bifunctional 5,10-methylenetetrahydrofolate dehydrogenase/5,10-methenyltetrahydrofolate cyclohydrolase [Lachnospiraceae bacterium]